MLVMLMILQHVKGIEAFYSIDDRLSSGSLGKKAHFLFIPARRKPLLCSLPEVI